MSDIVEIVCKPLQSSNSCTSSSNLTAAAAAAAGACSSSSSAGDVIRHECQDKVSSLQESNVVMKEEMKPQDFSMFRTKSLRAIKTYLCNKLLPPVQADHRDNIQSASSSDSCSDQQVQEPSVPTAGRYFDALEGPELEVLKGSEQVVLLPPIERWPFLLRFPINCFAIPMGLGSQAILWKNLALSPPLHFLHIPTSVNLVLWCLALAALVIIFATYALKCILYFGAVKREFYHPVRINYFFAPWIACMLLLVALPPSLVDMACKSNADIICNHPPPAWYCTFMLPLFLLELKIYGQWMSGDERRLSRVANPSTHMAVVGNFTGAQVGALIGWKEIATALWAIGIVHYLVVFVTLYQRLPTNETLPKELHPVFFLFIAAPSAASVAWLRIAGEFDMVARIVFFIAIFLLSSLGVRLNFFRGPRFSISWWAYIFPTTAASVASIHYCEKVTNMITKGLASALSFLSTAMLVSLFLTTCHTCMWGTFLPNDVAIAITRTKRRKLKPK